MVDLLGMLAGHVYYYLEDVYPRISGRRPLTTPGILKALFPGEGGGGRAPPPTIRPLVEDQGGGGGGGGGQG